MVTYSNDPPKQNKYVGQIKQFDPRDPAMTSAHILGWVDTLTERYLELAEMRRDIADFAEQFARIHDISFFTNEEQTFFLGPKSPATQSKSRWTLDLYIANRGVLPRIRRTIEDMQVHGRRIRHKKTGS